MFIDTCDVTGTRALRKTAELSRAGAPLVSPIGRVLAMGFEPVRQPPRPIHGYGSTTGARIQPGPVRARVWLPHPGFKPPDCHGDDTLLTVITREHAGDHPRGR